MILVLCASIAAKGQGMKLLCSDWHFEAVYFEPGSTDVDLDSASCHYEDPATGPFGILKGVATWMVQDSSRCICVCACYALNEDSVLATYRAQAIARRLVALGVPMEQVRWASMRPENRKVLDRYRASFATDEERRVGDKFNRYAQFEACGWISEAEELPSP